MTTNRQPPEQTEARLITEIERQHGKTVSQLRDEREKRVRDAMELRVPDRVPVNVSTGVFAAKYAGLTASAMYYDHPAYRAASRQMLLDFEPDNGPLGVGSSGLALELLDSKQYRWPGGSLPADGTYQFVEGEYMLAGEYGCFLANPADFVVRAYLPRIYGALEPLAGLAPLTPLTDVTELAAILGLLYRPEFSVLINVLERLHQPGLTGVIALLRRVQEEQQRLGRAAAEFAAEMGRLGFPSGGGPGGSSGATFAPFDTISDRLRSMRGAMLDMFRGPAELLTACSRILDWEMSAAVPARPDPRGNPVRSGMPLHRGSDGFMSRRNFEQFYWPTLKRAIEMKVALGYTVTPFFEGIWDDRLEYLLDLPKGKVVFYCEKTDVFRAKQIIGSHLCIQGGVPPTILQTGSPQDVEAHCRRLIQTVGKDGGFILSAGSVIDHATPANVRAMVDTVKKYGRY
jgi:hypothetical protein